MVHAPVGATFSSGLVSLTALLSSDTSSSFDGELVHAPAASSNMAVRAPTLPP